MAKQENPNIRTNKLIDSNDILFIWRLVLKNLIFIIIIPVFSYGIGYIYTHRLHNIYGAKAELLLKSNETYDYQDPIYKGLGAYGMYMDVQNQIRILKSYDLISEVIEKIHVETSYFIVGRLKKQEVFGTLPFHVEVSVLNSNVYEAPIAVKILDKNNYLISYSINGSESSIKGEFNKEVIHEDLIINLVKNYTFQEESMNSITAPDYEIMFHTKNNLIQKYRGRLTVENIEYTSILNLMITDELAPRAKVFLDTLTATYIDYSKRIQLEVNQNTLENIEKQIDTISDFIKEKETELIVYKDQNSILNIEREEDDFFEEYLTYSREKREIERKKSSVVSLHDYLENSYDDRVLPPSFFIEGTDLYLRETIDEIRKKQIELEIERTRVTEENLRIQNKKSEIIILKNDVIRYLGNLEQALDTEIEILTKLINKYEADIKSLPKSAQGILNMQRELDVNNKMYLFLLEKKTNTLIARAGIIPQVRQIEQTLGLGVVSPDRTKILRLFILGGLLLSILIAIIRNVFFEKIESMRALSDATSMSVVGGVPFTKDAGYSLMIESSPKSQIAESLRTIRTNLSYMQTSNKCARKVLVSSYHPGEGKTFCSTNLSTLIARGEKKVLIIDFDLHRPKIHKVFDLDNAKGLSTFIIGKADVKDIINYDIKLNLDVVTSGPIAPNPSELVMSNKIDEFISEVENDYDVIVIDTPPFGVLNDTFELLKKVDNFLIVLRSGRINKRGIDHISTMLDKVENVNKGLILNGIKTSKLQYYYSKYGYNYSYGYNYGYGYDYSTYTDDTK